MTMPLGSVLRLLIASALLSLVGTDQRVMASVIISSHATRNMSCVAGVCTPSAQRAVLNVGDLEALLASGDTRVASTGTGVEANNIVVADTLNWSTSSMLTLDSHHSIAIRSAVAVGGPGGLVLTTNDGGADGWLSFDAGGNVTFARRSGKLTIDGTDYKLEYTLRRLARDIAANAGGTFALARNYDAEYDGTYSSSPITTSFNGKLEGLGNTISNLTIVDRRANDVVGLFRQVFGRVEYLGLSNVAISETASRGVSTVGGLAGYAHGPLFGDSVSGYVHADGSSLIGGLVGQNVETIYKSTATATVTSDGAGSMIGGLIGWNNTGTIIACSSGGAVTAGANGMAGGLVGNNYFGIIKKSWSEVAVTAGSNSSVGGLVGYHNDRSSIADSYATGGAVTGGTASDVGGLVGGMFEYASIVTSYSTGAVTGGSNSILGGLVGYDGNNGQYIVDAYWNITTSGIADTGQGAGNISDDPGITGLSTEQLIAGLPGGFDPAIWDEQSTINNGLPYLLVNPPLN